MDFSERLPTPVDAIELPLSGKRVLIKRDDLVHPIVSGNKWRKLSGWISHYHAGAYEEIVSYGGAYSNHLLALAECCRLMKIPCRAYVRGDELHQDANIILQSCAGRGMQLNFMSRTDFDGEQWRTRIHTQSLIIPAGGTGPQAEAGLRGMLEELNVVPDHVFIAAGTGTTVATLADHFRNGTSIHALCVAGDLEEMKSRFPVLGDNHVTLYRGKGFARIEADVMVYIALFLEATDILLDPVYTAPTLMLLEKAGQTQDLSGSVLFIHTGGMTGLLSETCRKHIAEMPDHKRLDQAIQERVINPLNDL